MKKFAPFLFAVLFLAGCVSAPDVTTYVNPLSNRRTDVLSQNLLDVPYSDRELIWLNAFRDYSDAFQYKYYLEVVYGARQDVGYLDIGPGRTLTIIADEDELKFSGLGSSLGPKNRWEEKGVVYESARFDASSYDVNRIAMARKVTVKVAGKNGLVVREFGPENFERFRTFVAQTGGM
jgi:hypothetical protein